MQEVDCLLNRRGSYRRALGGGGDDRLGGCASRDSCQDEDEDALVNGSEVVCHG